MMDNFRQFLLENCPERFIINMEYMSHLVERDIVRLVENVDGLPTHKRRFKLHGNDKITFDVDIMKDKINGVFHADSDVCDYVYMRDILLTLFGHKFPLRTRPFDYGELPCTVTLSDGYDVIIVDSFKLNHQLLYGSFYKGRTVLFNKEGRSVNSENELYIMRHATKKAVAGDSGNEV